MDHYFRRHALPNTETGVSTAYVLPPDHDTGPVRGFYTLSMASVETGAVANTLPGRPPTYASLGVVLLGRLAVHRDHQGAGLGDVLLRDALTRAVGTDVGHIGIVTDPLNDQARAWYLRCDFVPVGERGRLFLPRKRLEAVLTAWERAR